MRGQISGSLVQKRNMAPMTASGSSAACDYTESIQRSVPRHFFSQMASVTENKISEHRWHPCRTWNLGLRCIGEQGYCVCFSWADQLLPICTSVGNSCMVENAWSRNKSDYQLQASWDLNLHQSVLFSIH